MLDSIKRFFATGKCQSCETLFRLLESKDAQIAMVLSKHYDKPVIHQVAPPKEESVDVSHLIDVTNVSDEEFLNEMNKKPS